jgi:light-regulated signal transduction histidine kinase (bacteriophytochrome)
MIETIRHICSDTISMADMLLEYARLSRMEPNNLLIDLRKLFKDVFMAMDHTGKGGRTPDLTFDPEIPHIVGDEGLFRQALLNILSNAVKFTQTKENPEIRVGYERTDESHIFYVRDNGVGFDMKYADKLFDMFQRMHSSDEFEGSGVGLSIIKKILDIHQGKVWIEGAVDQGATIYFSLPDARVLCE